MWSVALASLVALAEMPSAGAAMCSIGELRNSPDYQWSAERIAHFVDSADVIVRVKAVARDSLQLTSKDGTAWWPAVRLETLEAIRDSIPNGSIVLYGELVDRDDFNTLPIPYRMVRRAGQRGDCFATEYRLGAEYLLLLKRLRSTLTAQWKGLAPLNEQVRGADDPWVRWVHDRASSRR
jgi:hypothetical protein